MARRIIFGYGGVLAGVIITAVGVSFFLIPAKIAAGGRKRSGHCGLSPDSVSCRRDHVGAERNSVCDCLAGAGICLWG